MVLRRVVVVHGDEEHDVDYDTDDGLFVLRLQIYSLVPVPPDEQRLVGAGPGGADVVVADDADLDAIGERIRVLSVQDEEAAQAQLRADEELARKLQEEEEAQLWSYNTNQQFQAKVEPYVRQVLMYEDNFRQEAAQKTVPVDELEEKALVWLAKEGNFNPSKDEKDHSFLLQLLFWFKQSFRWVHAPPCDSCGGGTSAIGMGMALPSELQYGASRVELYRCSNCFGTTRFPRYNDPCKLVETRRGRCGEWANCFTLYCRAFGYDARLILDFTDHVWTECFSNLYGRWMHLDPCEGIYDKPLLYEKGWNKKLNYTIGISKDGVYDVTRRYTRKWHDILSRRTITTEAGVSSVLSSITKRCRTGYPIDLVKKLEDRDKREAEELEQSPYLNDDASVSLPGRVSGSVEWRKSRAELGLAESESLSSSSCPVRVCVDAHVSRIHKALALLCHTSGPRTVEVLGILRNLVLDLKKSGFRNRRSLLDSEACENLKELMHCIEEFFTAIAVKGELRDDGALSVTISESPVHTSLALPVALDAIDEIASNYKNTSLPTKDISFPKSNRLSSGSVLASSEELPLGIATSAFDGIKLSKWEEPNGAKGCWLIYRVFEGQMCYFVSYDFMSANDSPERDPMDWILEGSADEGANWTVIDKQRSQMFDERFLRKSFVLQKPFKGNVFRFNFQKVRESNSNSRLQIGCIDLYGETN